MDHPDKLYALLTDAAEDCSSFWDAVWEIADGNAANDSEAELMAKYNAAVPEAQSLLMELLLLDWIGIYRGLDWHSPLGANQEALLASDEAKTAILEPSYWTHPSDDAYVDGPYCCFSTTEAGYQLWLKGKMHFCQVMGASQNRQSDR